MSSASYESWFVSARDPDSPRALWIRHTRLRRAEGEESAALWCTLADASQGDRPGIVKQIFSDFPAGAIAGPERFLGSAELDGRAAAWDLAVSGGEPALRPLPAALMRAPLPRAKLEVSVPDGWVDGTVSVAGHAVEVSRWRGTVGHNWGAGHADRWLWLHGEFGAGPGGWLELVLARIMIGPVRSPWTAMGAISLDGERIALGGLGRRPLVDATPGRLTAVVPARGARLRLTMRTSDDGAVTVRYADPSGGGRTVRHGLLAIARLSLLGPGNREVDLTTSHAACEYGTSAPRPDVIPEPLPEG